MRPRLTYANVVATLALVIAVGGGAAYAANTVFSSDIVDGQVKTPDLDNGAVANGKLADGAVTSDKIADESLKGRDVFDNSLRGADIDESTLSNIGGGGAAGGDLTGTYPNPEIAPDAVTRTEVANNSLRGADIAESTLGQVPSSLLGGFGRSSGGGGCDPQSTDFVNCALVTVDLPAPARLLLIGRATGHGVSNPEGAGQGTCHIGSTSGPFPETTTSLFVEIPFSETVSMVAVSGVFPPGQHSFGIDCNQTDSDREILFNEAGIAAVAISPS